jgi:hypothetical protein
MLRNRYQIRAILLGLVALAFFALAGLELSRGYVRVGPKGLPRQTVRRADDPGTFWRTVAVPLVSGGVLTAFAAFNFRLGRR